MDQIRSKQIAVDTTVLAHDLILRAALEHADEPAITGSDGSTLTYQDLLDQCERAVSGLRGLGVVPEVPVAVWLDRSPELIVSMLAILRAGGVYAPIDSSCPPERFAAIVADLGAPILLTDREPPRQVRESGIRLVRPRDLMVSSGGAEAAAPPEMDNLAYLLSTSGSTGRPKWVAMTHRGLARLIRWQAASGPAGLTTASFTSPGFDVTFQEVLSTLGTGGRLYLVSEEARRDPEKFLAALDEQAIERVFLPYVALEQLAGAARRAGRVPSSLRHVVTAGERLVITDAIAEFFARLPECRLDNHYGPTEAHLVTSMTLDEGNRPWPPMPAIGTAVSSADPYLLDENLGPVSLGEIYVGGDAVARGYLSSPSLTAQRFLPDPFSTVPGSRMYRTGDLARLESDGLLHFLGRGDEQVKIRGYRVELGEVEVAVSRYPGVRQVAVGVRELTGGVNGLVAYLVTDGPEVSISELSGFLSQSLPGYMVPSRFVFLDSLPLTPSGKADRRRLAEVPLPAIPGAAPGSTTSLVDAITAIWQRVLGHDEFEPDDDFFDIGGDSLLAAWVITELSQLAGRDVELSVLLEDSTVEGLAERLASIGDATGTRPTSEIVTLRPGPAGRVLYFCHALGGEVFSYREVAKNITSPVRVLGVRWAGEADPDLTLSEVAAVHREQIQAVQPIGPYLLAGWSFGGVLALEIAQQLRAAGENVEFLGLLDANPVRDPITGVPPKQTKYLALLSEVLAEIDRRGLAGEESVDVSQLASDEVWTVLMGGAPTTGMKVAHLRRNLAIACQSMHGVREYLAQPYPGDVDLFQANAADARMRQELAGELRGVVNGELRVHDVPGDHNSMLAVPQVTVLAAAVDLALESIIEKTGADHES